MPNQHAKLSPSSSERWLGCPASIRMEALAPPQGESAYASEGTAAHALAEIEASFKFGMIDGSRKNDLYESWAREWGVRGEQLAEMKRNVLVYVNLLEEKLAGHPDSQLLLEQRMDTGIPTCWGTSDAVIVSPDHVEIVDFKYGQGVYVDVEGNSQLRLYALGALDTFADLLGETKEIRVTVCQPRLNHTDTEVLTPEELQEWREEIRPIAELALGPDAPFGPSETACRWCPMSGRCKAQLEQVFSEDFESDPEDLSPEQMAETLTKVPAIRLWLKAFEEAALSMAYSEGKQIPGWKVVMSGGRRVISDQHGAIEALMQIGYEPDQISKRSLLGIGDLEKILGKDDFGTILEDFITKSEGRPSLVVESDRRRSVSPDAEAVKEFGGEK